MAGYPLTETDELEPYAIWDFCGAFPLAEIAKGRRACRAGWRNRSLLVKEEFRDECRGEFGMIAVVLGAECNEREFLKVLYLEREWDEDMEIEGRFAYLDDMLANDWYLERTAAENLTG
ncbi:MAG: hypothetical protein WCT16_00085 [Candidatus Buchananbacteria bacterium]